MILDDLKHFTRYEFLDKIAHFDFSKYNDGRFEIGGNDFFGIGLTYVTKDKSDCLWEAHRKYLDVHVILEGEEKIQICNIENMSITKEYDAENDYALFDGKPEHEVVLKKGSFICLYPNEVHKTAIQVNSPTEIKKIVFKILL